jgi:hypothetical protein
LDIYRKPPPPKNTIFSIPTGLQISADGKSQIVRDDFTLGGHELVSLERWWMDESGEYLGDMEFKRADLAQSVRDLSSKADTLQT